MVLNVGKMSFHAYASQNTYDAYEDDRYGDDPNNYDNAPYDSEEDTDDASETEFRNHNRSGSSTHTNGNNNELKEQMYQHKLARLKKEMDELKQHAHPEYLKRVKKLEIQCKERIRLNEVSRDYMKECVERDYLLEKKAAQKEYDEKRVEVKENIITDYEEKKQRIESERFSLELTNDSMEIKPTVTRKLRRRPNDPVPVVEKRRKPATGQLVVYLLDDKDIDNDLKSIQRGKPITPTLQQNGIGSYGNHQSNNLISSDGVNFVEARIEDGKLWYERRWFHRGQQVYVEGKDMQKFPGTISAIGNEVVCVKRANDSKVKIPITHLAKSNIFIKRRAN